MLLLRHLVSLALHVSLIKRPIIIESPRPSITASFICQRSAAAVLIADIVLQHQRHLQQKQEGIAIDAD